MGGEDFTGLIDSIKKKEEPQIHFRSNKVLSRQEEEEEHDAPIDEVSISSPQREDMEFPEEETCGSLVRVTVRAATPPTTPQRVVAHLFQEEEGDNAAADNESQVEEDSFESCEESVSNSIVSDGLGQPAPLSRTDPDAPLSTRIYHFGEDRINSILESAAGDESPVEHNVRWTTADRLKYFDLTSDEVNQQRVNGGVDAEDIMGGNTRGQWARKIPGLFCASSAQIHQAAEVVSKALSEGMEKAKVCSFS
jgi:hypothetical protein